MIIQDWGLIDFNEAWRRQRELVDAILRSDHPDTLVMCEHPPVITLGRTTQQGSVVVDPDVLKLQHVDVIEINRGGEATVHNPGQLVGYPIFNLTRTKPDLHWFLRTIEQCIIDVLHEYEVVGGRVDGLTGVWIDGTRKICAIGIHCSRWITSHGFALNVNNDLGLFDAIVPCGIRDKGVTSLEAETGRVIEMRELRTKIADSFRKNFGKTL
ncbi:MAG TPA: lipoyl(octanoyl) transferase LipB [Candidatus Didemnitutus sp.]|nr:lipoyl(octanoyl) transferase LipB [Candidatus Didemnitutus sp.]